ncbi:MAG TPA: thioredoxin [Sphingobacteriaceae bacterium]
MSKFQDLINSDNPVLVDFFADWCGPCKVVAPILSEVKSQVRDEVTIIKVDIDKNPEVAHAFHVKQVPTLILFKKGKIKWRQAGVVTTPQLVHILKHAPNA